MIARVLYLLIALAVLAGTVPWNENGRRGWAPSRPETSTSGVNVGEKVSKRRNRGNKTIRAERFGSTAALRKAVTAWCISQAEKLSGDPAFAAGLQESIKATVDVDPYPRQVWRALAGALGEALDLYKDVGRGEFSGSVYAERIEMLFRNAPFASGTALLWRAMLEVDSDIRMPEDMQRRARVVAMFDVPQKMWWGDRQPTPRELAIISLLAGEFPEGQRRQQVEGSKSGIPLQMPTVLEVVRAEERAVGIARKRIDMERREYANKMHARPVRTRGAWLRRV